MGERMCQRVVLTELSGGDGGYRVERTRQVKKRKDAWAVAPTGNQSELVRG